MLIAFWFVGVIGLLLYSYTQIDLSLTLSRVSFIQQGEKIFQSIGYNQRPLSTAMYIILLIILFVSYIIVLNQVSKQKISERLIWRIILITAGILLLAYNAFSYDLFNYMFGAKEILQYHANPYTLPPWDFKNDHMLPFMRNIDKTYVYGPLSLLFTLPLTLLGFGLLLPTFLLYKMLSVGAYIGTCYMMLIILKKSAPERALFGVTFFALNPLVIIESLVSAHNDIWMMCLAMVAFWYLLMKKYLPAFFSLIVSFLTKQVTASLIPLFFLAMVPFLKKHMTLTFLLLYAIILQFGAASIVLKQRQLQPWYFLWLLPFIAMLPKNIIVSTFTIGFSLALILQYVPYLFDGTWQHVEVFWGQVMLIIPVISFWIGVVIWLKQKPQIFKYLHV